MANSKYNKYIGARYVPLFKGEWEINKTYEPLVIVSYQGNSYTSKTFVPINTQINNEEYWALTGNYNAQIEAYRQEVESLKNSKINYSDIVNNVIDGGINKVLSAEQGKILNNSIKHLNRINVKDFGAKGDGITDDTNAIISAITKASELKPCEIFFPAGVYCFIDLGVINIENIGFIGESPKAVILKCLNNVTNHIALNINAFNDEITTPIKFGFNLKNIIVQCNINTLKGIVVQGYARLDWEHVYVKNLGGVNSVAFHLKGVHESNFYSVCKGDNYTGVEQTRPSIGLIIDRSIRAGVVEGSCTNNTFINCYFENCVLGCDIIYGDQNTFITCAMQGNEKGLNLQNNAIMNNFIGLATEKNTSKMDIEDNGRTNNFINCYTEYTMKIAGMQGNIMGGKIPNLIVNGEGYFINGVRVNTRGVDDGGLVVNNNGNNIHSILDLKEGVNAFIYNLPPRKNIAVTSSPFTYTNNTKNIIEVIIQSGELTEIKKQRGGSSFLVNKTTPNTYLLAPTESLIISYSTTPSMSYMEYNAY